MKKLTMLLLIVTLGAFISSPAFAVPIFELKLVDTTGLPVSVAIADGAILDLNPAAGAITYIGAVGIWNLNVTTGLGEPAIQVGRMDLNSVNANSASPGTLQIWFSGIDNSQPIPGWEVNVGGTLGGTAIFKAFYDPDGNTYYGTGTTLATLGPFGPGGAFSGSATGPNPNLADTDYTMTLFAEITHTAINSTSFNLELKPVPEPATMLLLGSGLIGLAGIGRRKFFKK